MSEILVPIVSIIFFFSFLFGAIYIYLSTRNRERLALIEKGYDASLFKSEKNSYGALKWGMLLLGVAVGILFGYLLDSNTNMDEEISYFSMIFLFGGLALVLYYFLQKKLQKNTDTDSTAHKSI